MADEYVKVLKVKVEDTEVQRLKRETDDMTSLQFIDKDQQEAFKKVVNDAKILNAQTELIKKNLQELEGLKGPEAESIRKQFEAQLEALTGEKAKERKEAEEKELKDFYDSIEEFTKNKLNRIANNIQQFFTDIYNDAKEMMSNIAAFSEKSGIFSSEATGLKLSYGLSGAEAYAWSQAAKDVGFSSFDDYLENFMYATDETNERLQKLVEKYTETYEQDKEIAEAYQKFQTEFTDFKKQLQMELIDFFMNNKDTIKTVLQATIEFMKAMLQLVGWIVNFLSGGHERSASERASSLSDIYNNYGAASNTNVKIDNTFNGVGSNDKNMLINAGSLVYRQALQIFEK